MCIRSHSESGQPCGFEPCEAYKSLLQKSRELTANLDNNIEILEIKNTALQEELESSQQDHLDTIIERDALRKERDRLAKIVEKADALEALLTRVSYCYEHEMSIVTVDKIDGALGKYRKARHAV